MKTKYSDTKYTIEDKKETKTYNYLTLFGALAMVQEINTDDFITKNLSDFKDGIKDVVLLTNAVLIKVLRRMTNVSDEVKKSLVAMFPKYHAVIGLEDYDEYINIVAREILQKNNLDDSARKAVLDNLINGEYNWIENETRYFYRKEAPDFIKTALAVQDVHKDFGGAHTQGWRSTYVILMTLVALGGGTAIGYFLHQDTPSESDGASSVKAHTPKKKEDKKARIQSSSLSASSKKKRNA